MKNQKTQREKTIQGKIPQRNMALFRGLLVLSLSCLQVPCLVASLGRDLRGEGRQIVSGPTQEKLEPLSFLMLGNQESRGHTALKKAPGDCKEALTPEQNRRLAQAMMAFTTDLFSLVAQRSTSPNLILSPLSVALALSHLALGTVAAPVQTSRAGWPVGTHLSRVTPPLESLGCLVKCRPTFSLCETDS